MSEHSPSDVHLPETCLPAWSVHDLPEPRPLSWKNWVSFIGPGIVMCGIQIGGGEWLYGPAVTAKYGGGLMWIATIAIILQVFYNIECGRYALYCGEPMFTGMLRTKPGPTFWMGVILILNFAALIPGLSTHGASLFAALLLNRPPGPEDRVLVISLAYVFLFAVALPVLIGGKVYNMLQTIMTAKVVIVLGFCLLIGVLFVSPTAWWNVFSGFVKFGTVPIKTETVDGTLVDGTVNVFQHLSLYGTWPVVALGNMAVLGAFAGYAGGGGLSNATYGNFVRDKGWGMGQVVGAIPSAIGGKGITLSHLGSVFPLTADNLRRWRGWWRYILTDQVLVWGPGCFMGMALPALLSMGFAKYSHLGDSKLDWARAIVIADGLRYAPQFSAGVAQVLWIVAVFVGMMVMLPSQMSIVDDFSRRWTDLIWSGSAAVRGGAAGFRANRIYYSILGLYVLWSVIMATLLLFTGGSPEWMTLIIANLNNVAIGITSFHLLWINRTLLPAPLRPRWYSQLGLVACGVFYLGIGALVVYAKLSTQGNP